MSIINNHNMNKIAIPAMPSVNFVAFSIPGSGSPIQQLPFNSSLNELAPQALSVLLNLHQHIATSITFLFKKISIETVEDTGLLNIITKISSSIYQSIYARISHYRIMV